MKTESVTHTPLPWSLGMRGGHNANGIYARDGESNTAKPEDAAYFDTNVCQVGGISMHSNVEEAKKNDRNAVGLANAEFIIRACNSHAALVSALEKLLDYTANGRGNSVLVKQEARAALKSASPQ